MLIELGIATLMVLLTVLVHTIGLLILAMWVRVAVAEEHERDIHPLSPRGVMLIVSVVLGLFVVHGIEIWSYALLYLKLDAVDGLREAVYFSTITYAAIGYDDEPIADAWKLIAGIEGVNGLLLLGWSTAFFVTVINRLARG
jgi:hypothetical protein